MKAILRTYQQDEHVSDKVVEIDDSHNFNDGPYVDTIPFSVGSNQEIVPLDWVRRDHLDSPQLYPDEVLQQYQEQNDRLTNINS